MWTLLSQELEVHDYLGKKKHAENEISAHFIHFSGWANEPL